MTALDVSWWTKAVRFRPEIVSLEVEVLIGKSCA